MKIRLLLSTLLLIAPLSFAATYNVTFTAPTTRESGAPLAASEIKHYELLDSYGGSVTTYVIYGSESTIVLVQPGSHTLTAYTVDSDDVKSKPSNTVIVDVPVSAPACPTDLRITYLVDPTGSGR
jgi:hypothetical protein